jgi:UDP-N-acetyl-D-mannosaminuronic acid dehydrogenase
MSAYQRICVIGLGYIGLPTSAVFADSGVEVVGVDVNEKAVASINAGQPHIVEPDLEQLLQRVVKSGKFRATTNIEPAQAFILAVPTPFMGDHQPDIRYVEAACKSIAPVLAKGNLTVLESTSPVGTTEQVSQWLAAARPDLSFPHQVGDASDIRIAYCPERVLPGRILHEVVHNARVIGGITRKCADEAARLYMTFIKGECHLTTARTAELAKLAENSFRDVNIAFANELSVIAHGLGIDVWELIRITNLHPRVNVLNPGPGVGGHCIAVDPWFIVAADPKNSKLIRAAREVNNAKPHFVVDQVLAAAEGIIKPVIACLGLSYKANVDDFRESPAVEIVEELAYRRAGTLLVVEPYVTALPLNLVEQGVTLAEFDEGLRRSDIILLLVDHAAFTNVSAAQLAGKKVVDTRGVWRQRMGAQTFAAAPAMEQAS